MKIVLSALALFCLTVMTASAQEQTLLEGTFDNGGFGGPAIQVTSINGQLGVLVGGGGGWIVDHTFSIGGFGFALVNDVTRDDVGADSARYIDVSYGGIHLQYIHNSDEVVHFTATALIGGGGLGTRAHRLIDDPDGFEWNNDAHRPSDAFFVFEPGVNVELNIHSHVRLMLGGSYRVVAGVQTAGMTNETLGGPNGLVMVKFGSF